MFGEDKDNISLKGKIQNGTQSYALKNIGKEKGNIKGKVNKEEQKLLKWCIENNKTRLRYNINKWKCLSFLSDALVHL